MNVVRKYSRKREAIMQLLRNTKTHPNAEWIYTKLKPEFPDLSLGTVYRNLSMFREEGTVCCVASVNGQERFDADTSSHAHFICNCCGKVEDIEHAPKLQIPPVRGKVEAYQLNYYGVCEECGKKAYGAPDQQ